MSSPVKEFVKQRVRYRIKREEVLDVRKKGYYIMKEKNFLRLKGYFRNQGWSEKKVLRYINKTFERWEKGKLLLIYRRPSPSLGIPSSYYREFLEPYIVLVKKKKE